ncbi:MAG: D-cysteine desulfhydrase family protein [Bacteroidales bacterium]|jgi:1-aminocyclopropane-1-carboxylate deaminase/D-cysteine desulfhydrase-like pyridoxal-dependent ACC family enzyme
MATLASIPRISIAPLDTPIDRCDRLRQAVPGMPEVYVKHDDYIGSLVWGNKLRKLEYCYAEAKRLGADTIITCGGTQSNHARITAQTARRFGFEVVLVLNGVIPAKPTANLLINSKMGVKIHYVGSRQERSVKMQAVKAELEKSGKKVYSIPLGASDEIGSFGFVKAMEELKKQEKALGYPFDYIFHSSSSGGTQAGLEVGKRLFNMTTQIIGVSADNSVDEIRGEIMEAAGPIQKRLRMKNLIKPEEIRVETGFIGPGYGVPSDESLEAQKIFAETEGILLDQTYTAKAAAALIAYARKGFFKPADRVLFWHTGGLINLFQ